LLIRDRIGFGQRQTVFVDAELFAYAFFARVRVERGDAFVKQVTVGRR
jgi:hypothetical protein